MREQVEYLKRHRSSELSLQDIRSQNLVPWARDFRTLGKMIKQDFFGENLLEARIEGEGRQARYFIRASNLLTYIETYGPYLMGTTRKPKQLWKKQRSRSSSKKSKTR